MMKAINLVFFIFLALLSIQLDGQTCNDPPDSKTPGGDNADDNYSNAITQINDAIFYSLNPEILVLKNGFYSEATNLISKLNHSINIFTGDEITSMDSSGKQIIIPTGGLYGKKNDSTLKYALEQFVSKGGVILCYAQQDSDDYSVLPVPPGEALHCEGWRSSQSCYHGSIYYENMHPIFAGQASQRISAGVDGGVSVVPAGTTIFIRRTATQEPALIMYSYGENHGKVLITAAFSDWSFARGACTLTELKLTRDLLTYLKAPNLEIPMYDTSSGSAAVQLNVGIKNSSQDTAAKATVKVYTPDRDQLLYMIDAAVTLAPGEETTVPVSFTITDVQASDLGIGHCDYEIFDTEDNLLEPAQESNSGRFALYRTPTPYVPSANFLYWLSVNSEEIHTGDPVSFVLHARNNTMEEKNVSFRYEWDHQGQQLLTSLTLPPGETLEFPFENEAHGSMFWVYPNNAGKIGKGFTLIRLKTRSYIHLDHYWGLKVGTPFSYRCEVNNTRDNDLGCIITLNLLDSQDNLLEILYHDTQYLISGGTFEFSRKIYSVSQESPGIEAHLVQPFLKDTTLVVRFSRNKIHPNVQPMEYYHSFHYLLYYSFEFEKVRLKKKKHGS